MNGRKVEINETLHKKEDRDDDNPNKLNWSIIISLYLVTRLLNIE